MLTVISTSGNSWYTCYIRR